MRVLLVTLLATAASSATYTSGWADCTGTSPSSRHVHKSWRSFAQHTHPDTAGGDSDDFQNSVLLRDALKDPDHFQIYKLLRNSTPLTPFNDTVHAAGEGGVVVTADLQVVQKCTNLLDKGKNSCSPYARLRVQFAFAPEAGSGGGGGGGALPHGAAWTLALGAQNVSTIQYHGDKARHGYDVCCDFVANSRCVRQHPALDSEADAGATAGATGTPPDPWTYAAHDCPVPAAFTAEVSRPLHVMRSGQWAATISIRDGAGLELACVAAAMVVNSSDVAAPAEDNLAPANGDGGGATTATPQQCNSVEGLDSGCIDSAPTPPAPPAEVEQVTFELVERGVFCEDGIDLLEGALDSYTDCTDIEGVCMLTAKCRAKCRKKKQCQFYTTYRNGWCQLSSSCSRKRKAGDSTARTFQKVTSFTKA